MATIIKFSGYFVDGMTDSLAAERAVADIKDIVVYRYGYRAAQHVRAEATYLPDNKLSEVVQQNCDLSLCEQHFQKKKSINSYDRPIPQPGEHWIHFKAEKIVEVIAVSRCTESPTSFSVIYRDPNGMVWDRPLDMFMSEVDHEKYPDSKEKYRFSKVKEG